MTPVHIGLERGDRRTRTTGTVRRVRGGGGPLRAVGVVMLLAGLAAVGAYLGLAAAHRTDLLARVGLPVPGSIAPVPAPTSGPVAMPTAPGAATAGPAGAGDARSSGKCREHGSCRHPGLDHAQRARPERLDDTGIRRNAGLDHGRRAGSDRLRRTGIRHCRGAGATVSTAPGAGAPTGSRGSATGAAASPGPARENLSGG